MENENAILEDLQRCLLDRQVKMTSMSSGEKIRVDTAGTWDRVRPLQGARAGLFTAAAGRVWLLGT